MHLNIHNDTTSPLLKEIQSLADMARRSVAVTKRIHDIESANLPDASPSPGSVHAREIAKHAPSPMAAWPMAHRYLAMPARDSHLYFTLSARNLPTAVHTPMHVQ